VTVEGTRPAIITGSMPPDAITTPLHTTEPAPWLSLRRWSHVRDVLRELIARDVKLRYRGSYFGMAWTLLNPITELAVLYFVFGSVLPLAIPNYAAFLFTGLLVYTWFQSSLFSATVAVVSNRDLIRRPNVPLPALPIISVASTLLHFLLSLPVLLALLLITGVPVTPAVLVLPLLIGVQFVFILALAYPLAALHVWFRDTQYFLKVGLQLLFFLTPVFYEAKTVPEQFRYLYALNPMVGIVDGYRDVLVRGVVPPWETWLPLLTASTGLLLISLAGFRRASRHFADEL
jgi:lipopolysaccharide transport system permease protein